MLGVAVDFAAATVRVVLCLAVNEVKFWVWIKHTAWKKVIGVQRFSLSHWLIFWLISRRFLSLFFVYFEFQLFTWLSDSYTYTIKVGNITQAATVFCLFKSHDGQRKKWVHFMALIPLAQCLSFLLRAVLTFSCREFSVDTANKYERMVHRLWIVLSDHACCEFTFYENRCAGIYS